MNRGRHCARLVAVAFAGCLVGCAAAIPIPKLRLLTPTERERAIALGALDEPAASPLEEGARLQRIAAFHAEVGNWEEAGEAVERLLALRRAHLALAIAGERGFDEKAARARLDEARALLVDIGRRTNDVYLVFEALHPSPEPGDPHAAAFLWAAMQAWSLEDDQYAAALKLARGPRDRLRLDKRWPPPTRTPPLTVEELVRLGRDATEVLSQRLRRAAHDHGGAGAIEAARALARIDPGSLEARVAIALLDERRSDLLDAAIGGYASQQAFARLELARRKHPESVAIRLALAVRYLDAWLVADASAMAREVANAPGVGPEVRATAEAVAALAALRAGDITAYQTWARRGDWSSSPSLLIFVAERDRDDAPAAVREIARRARRELTARGYVDEVGWYAYVESAVDEGQPLGARRAASAKAAEHAGSGTLAALRHCLSTETLAKTCRARVDAVTAAEDDEGGHEPDQRLEAVLSLGDVPEFLPRWLWVAEELNAPQLERLAPLLDRLAGTRVAAAPEFASASLLVAVARGDARVVRARLADVGRLLPTNQRLRFRAALIDLERGALDGPGLVERRFVAPGLKWARTWIRPEDHEGDFEADLDEEFEDQLREQHPGDSLTERIGRALGRWERSAAATEPELRALAAELDGPERDYLLALANLGFEQAPTRDELVARLALGGDVVTKRRYLAAFAEGLGADELDRARRVVAMLNHRSDLSIVEHAIDATQIVDGKALALLVRAMEDDEAAARFAWKGVSEWLFRSALAWFERRVRAAEPSEAVAIAREARRYFEATERADPESWLYAWYVFLSSEPATSPLDHRHQRWLAIRPRLTDELAHAAFRVSVFEDGDPIDVARRIAQALPDSDEARGISCIEWVANERGHEAFDVCARAWMAGPLDEPLAVALSFLQTAYGPQMRGRGLDGVSLFAEVDARKLHSATLWANRSFWLAGLGRNEEAAHAAIEAWVAGWNASQGGLPEGLEPHLGALARVPTHPVGATGFANAAIAAVESAEPEIARAYLDAAARWGFDWNAEDAGRARLARDWVALVERDLEKKTLTRASLVAAAHLFARPTDDLVRELGEANPDSWLVRAIMLREQVGAREVRVREGFAIAREFPANEYIVGPLVFDLQLLGRYAEARRIAAAARAAAPGNPAFAAIQPPDRPDGPPAIPELARDPKSFQERLAAIGDRQLDAMHPIRLVDTRIAAEFFVPFGFIGRTQPFGAADRQVQVTVKSMVVPACRGAECLDHARREMTTHGRQPIWIAETTVPAGPALEVLDWQGDLLGVALVVATSKGVFLVTTWVLADRLEQALPTVRLVHESFQPLDSALSPAAAEALRVPDRLYVTDAERFESRRTLRRAAGEACPWLDLLARQDHDQARAVLLLDAYLAAPDVSRRRAVLTCVSPTSPAGARLGLPALLDEDTRVHVTGVEIVRAFPDVAIEGALATLGSFEAVRVEDEVAPAGWLELLAALPAAERASLVATLLESHDPRLRAAAIAAVSDDRDALSEAQLHELIRNAPASHALWATKLRRGRIDREALAILRARIDARSEPLEADELELAIEGARLVAARLERGDREWLASLAARAKSSDPERNDSAQRKLGLILQAHDVGIAMRAGRREIVDAAPETQRRAREWVDGLDRSAAPRGSVSRKRLSDATLAELLPGEAWTYTRVESPDLLVAAARSLYARIEDKGTDDEVSGRSYLRFSIDRKRSSVFRDESGIDLRRPIECASSRESGDRVCVAQLRDAAAAREFFLHRDHKRAAGLDLIHRVAGPSWLDLFLAPTGAGLSLQDLIAIGSKNPGGATILEERVRETVRVGDYVLDAFAIVQIDELEVERAQEYYLFHGDRVFAFSSSRLATEILAGRRDRRALANAPWFRKARANWSFAAAVESAAPTGESVRVVVEHDGLTLVAEGASVRWRSASSSLLPEGAIAWTPAGRGTLYDGSNYFTVLSTKGASGVPGWWASAAREGTVAWYGRPGEGIWSRWLAVAPLDPALRDSVTKAGGAIPPAGELGEIGGIWIALRDDVLVAGTPRELVLEALGRDRGTRVSSLAAFARGGDVAAGVRATVEALGRRDDRHFVARMLANAVELLREVRVEVAAKNGREVVTARWVATVGEGPSDLDVVEAWLWSKSRKNAAVLPRALERNELSRPLTLVIETQHDAARVAAAFTRGRRVTGRVIDHRHVEVIVTPGAAVSEPVPEESLQPGERALLLAGDDLIRTDAPAVIALAREIVPHGSSPAETARLVVDWLKRNMTYTLAPHSRDSLQILGDLRGDCTEYSVLAVSLLRAAGIPAEIRDGMAASSGSQLVAHAWVAYHDGTGWREIDPTWGETQVSSGHIEVSLPEILARISLDGLRITEVKSPPN